MTLEEFERAVLERLREYADDRPEGVLLQAMEENSDIVRDGYLDEQEGRHGVNYAAWNISQCI